LTVRPALVLLAILGIAACSKSKPPSTERLAILPFENLIAEGETDRVGPALLASDLVSAPDLDAVALDSVQQAYSLHANQFLNTYIVARNTKLQLQAEIEDAATHKMLRTVQVEGDAAQGMGPLVAKLAKEINGAAKSQNSPSNQAYDLLNRALRAANPAEQDAAFQSAIESDPHFGAAYTIWTRALLARGDQSRAADIAAQGESAGVDDWSKATLVELHARAQHDSGAEISALQKLTAMTPANGAQYLRLAELEFASRQFAASAAAYATALRLDPDNGAVENMLGYAEAYNGNLEQARQALKHYGQNVPEQRANAADSLGEVDFYSGDFSAAEATFLSANEFLKAAQARLMTGDVAGANQIFARLTKSQPYEKCQWEFLTGRRKSALAHVQEEAARAQGDRASLMWAQAAIWELQTGDRNTAAVNARKALAEAAAPAGRSLGALAQFLVQGKVQPSGSPTADALAAIFRKDFQAALPALEQAFAKTSPSSDGQIRVLLAWANLETGHFDRAKELVRFVPIPMASGDLMFTSLVFPRFFAVRGALFKRDGKQAEAQRDLQLFQQYSGDLPDNENR
jgi:tetratricopeptide (TPR) repeat protein